ncbi:MAG: PIN domain-containing protein, partial [Planctomycetota bacterium]
EVVASEVRDHLKKAALESVRLHKSFSGKARVLRNLAGDRFPGLFERFGEQDAGAIFEAAFDHFLHESDVTIVRIANAELEEVFRRYCETKPPFGTGKSKKSEFPDAIALDSIRRWAVENDTSIYVVSRDQGMKEYCDELDELSYVESVEQFLHLAVRQDEESADLVETLYKANTAVLEERLQQDFPSMGFYIDDRDGDIQDVTVTSTDIQGWSIVEIKDCIATIELYVTVGFSAQVSYDDLERGIYDSETKSLWTQTQQGHWDREFDGTVRVLMGFDPSHPKTFSIEDFTINNDESICVVYDDAWPYK